MELLKKLTECNAPSGCEKSITDILKAELEGLADELFTDVMGNLVAHKKGGGKKVMFAAHCDEIGIVVTFIEEKGFLRFSDVGGLYTKYLAGRRVCFKNGTVGVISTEPKNDKNALSKMFIDIGASSREEAEKLVSIGDMASFTGEFREQGGCVISKALDNRVGCYILIETLKKVNSDNDLYFVFTTQEEVGLRGARTAAYSINPDYALAVDVTDTGDTPEAEKMAVKLGEGAAIKVMDYSVICSSEVRESLIRLARDNGIKYQLEIMKDGGTDAGVMQYARGGVKTGGISVPTRYIHSPSEMVAKSDVADCIELCRLFAEK
ncbi:MAG: M42 family metallopeptidase [Clostridiales bacterium]|nr:M42 family metallopeptidase [Clostridiales bacterium]